MLEPRTETDQRSNSVDQRMSLASAIYLSVAGAAVFIVQPGFVQGLVEHNGFSEQQAGYIAAVEMWGIAIVTLLLTFFSHRVDWRKVLTIAAIVAAIGNLLSATTQDVGVFTALRGLTGLGSGVLISLSFTIIGLTSNPDRNFGFLIMWVLIYGAIGFLLMPIAYAHFGITAALLFFALMNLGTLPLIRYLPSSGQESARIESDARELPPMYKSLATATLFIYFAAQGVIWTYLFLIGTADHISEADVSVGLTVSQFFGIAGAFTAAMLGNRYGRAKSIGVGIFISIVSLAILSGDISPLVYGAAVCIFNYAWNLTHPFLLGALAVFDRTGKIVVHGVAAQMLGLAVGPAIAASIVSDGRYDGVIWAGCVLFALALATIALPLWKHRQGSGGTSAMPDTAG